MHVPTIRRTGNSSNFSAAWLAAKCRSRLGTTAPLIHHRCWELCLPRCSGLQRSPHPTSTAVIFASTAAYTTPISSDGAVEHPGTVGDIAAPARCVALSPVSFGFTVAAIVADGSSLLDEKTTLDTKRGPSARATTTTIIVTTAVATTTITTTTATTIATTIAAVVTIAAAGSCGRPVESRAGFDLGNAASIISAGITDVYRDRVAT